MISFIFTSRGKLPKAPLKDGTSRDVQNVAALWAACRQHAMANRKSVEAAGVTGEGMALGDNVFDAILAGPSAVVVSKEDWSDIWQRTPGGSINFDLPEMLEAAADQNSENPQETTSEFPFFPELDGAYEHEYF